MEKTPQKVETAVFELVNRRPSSFVLEGSEESGMPVHLDCPDARAISAKSMYIDPDTKKIVHIQHITGANTISVKEQKENGFVFLPQRDRIWIKGGRITLKDEGLEADMFNYLKNHSNNKSNKNRVPDSEDVFYEVPVQEFKRATLTNDKSLVKALNLISDLYETNASGGIQSFDEPRIDRLCKVFGIAPADSYEETVIKLKSLATEAPAWFLETELASSNEKRTILKQAIAMDVVSLLPPGASFKKTSTLFRKLSSKKEDAMIEELLTFLESPMGAEPYNEMLAQLQAAKESQL